MFVKVCGLSTAADVDAAVESGADAVGFVFAESPRKVSAALARRLVDRVPPGVLTVGVFRRQPVADVRRFAAESGVRAVQLHGDEPREDFDALEEWDLIRATSIGDRAPVVGERGEDMLLLDAPTPGEGRTWDWNGVQLPEGRWLLAGGLTPSNVGAAITAARPWGVDVSSGVESRRGVKDPALIRAFIRMVREHALNSME